MMAIFKHTDSLGKNNIIENSHYHCGNIFKKYWDSYHIEKKMLKLWNIQDNKKSTVNVNLNEQVTYYWFVSLNNNKKYE